MLRHCYPRADAAHIVLVLACGSNEEPETLGEIRFAVITLVIGILGLSVVIGLATVLATDFDVVGRKKTEQLDSLMVYLRYRRVPNKLKNEIIGFVEYLWSSGQAECETLALETMPESLKLRLDLALKQNLSTCRMRCSCSCAVLRARAVCPHTCICPVPSQESAAVQPGRPFGSRRHRAATSQPSRDPGRVHRHRRARGARNVLHRFWIGACV